MGEKHRDCQGVLTGEKSKFKSQSFQLAQRLSPSEG